MKKFENLFHESDYSHETLFFNTSSLISFNKDYFGECGIFLTKDYILILNKKISRTINYAGIFDFETKNTLFGRKVIFNIPIDNLTVEMDFNFDKDRKQFLSKLQELMENKENEIQTIIEREEYIQEQRKNMPYEELKKLKELYDLEILTEDEYKIKREEMLKDYL
ncbi:hypothetical protein [Mammaliicoccus sp. N-M50]|uniref:hypothetical protein n=1 Tax=Mammaliicoccus sp. N-M50 TaxID=2898709 RepID=UPI001EFC13F9|nr:hypothetical protein [Mammaliicoccus sp. N-M50]